MKLAKYWNIFTGYRLVSIFSAISHVHICNYCLFLVEKHIYWTAFICADTFNTMKY